MANSVDPDETPRSTVTHLGQKTASHQGHLGQHYLLRLVFPNKYGRLGRSILIIKTVVFFFFFFFFFCFPIDHTRNTSKHKIHPLCKYGRRSLQNIMNPTVLATGAASLRPCINNKRNRIKELNLKGLYS